MSKINIINSFALLAEKRGAEGKGKMPCLCKHKPRACLLAMGKNPAVYPSVQPCSPNAALIVDELSFMLC